MYIYIYIYIYTDPQTRRNPQTRNNPSRLRQVQTQQLHANPSRTNPHATTRNPEGPGPMSNVGQPGLTRPATISGAPQTRTNPCNVGQPGLTRPTTISGAPQTWTNPWDASWPNRFNSASMSLDPSKPAAAANPPRYKIGRPAWCLFSTWAAGARPEAQ